MEKNKRNNRKKRTTKPNPAQWHFPTANEFDSDIFGSYTGTPLMPERMPDSEDYEPVQDADDL